MNVLLLAPDFFPVWGGAGTYVTELARHLKEDVHMHILAPQRKEFIGHDKNQVLNTAKGLFPDNVTIHYIGNASDTFLYNIDYQIAVLRKVRPLIKELDIDLVHTHSSMPDLMVPASKMGVPVLTTIHNSSQMQINGWRKSNSKFSNMELSEKMVVVGGPFLNAAEKLYYSQDRTYIAVSKWTKDQFVELYNVPPERVSVVYNGVDPSNYGPEKRDEKLFDKYDPDRKGPVILYLARILELKGISTLLNAIPKVLKRCDASFIIGGPGNPGRLRTLPPRTKYIGYIDHEETPKYVASADAFVLPSFSETFSFSLLEAMASRTAVVSTTAGGIPEMMVDQKEGVLNRPGDVDQLADSLVKLIEDDTFRKMIAAGGRKRVEKDFTWDHTAQGVLDIYQKMTSGRR